MKPLSRVFLILTFSLCAGFALAQIPLSVRIYGEVLNGKHEPLHHANVLHVNTGAGTSTDVYGRYEMDIPVRESFLRFSFVGYKPHYVRIGVNEIIKAGQGGYYLPVVLDEELNILEQVRIIGRKSNDRPEKMVDEPTVSVVDFDFHDNNLVLLVIRSGKQHLQFRTLEDSLIYEERFKKKVSSFYRDCIGNLHLVCEDSVYQVFPLPWGFYFYTGTSTKLFKEIVEPCVASGGGNYIFERLAGHNQMKSYFTIHRDSQILKPLHFLFDEMAYLYASDYIDVLAGRENTNAFNSTMTDYRHREGEPIERRLADMRWFYEGVLTQPVYGPLVRIDTSVFIFDHQRDTCFNFGLGGALMGNVPFDFHKSRQWEKGILTDVGHQRIYGTYSQNGIYMIGEINPYSGTISQTYKVKEHLFPEKLKVKGDEVYYLKIGQGRKFLFRQYLGLLESN